MKSIQTVRDEPISQSTGSMTEELKLTIELVRQPCWGRNLRSLITRREWEAIRADVYERQGRKCGICGADGRFICHEIWDYDDTENVQRLKDFIAICDLCNHVKHLGLANVVAARGKLDLKEVEEHFMRVNGCDLETFRTHRAEAAIQYQERSRHEWRLDLGFYEDRIRKGEKLGRELDRLDELDARHEALEAEKDARLAKIMTPEITAKLEEIEAEFAGRSKEIEAEITAIKREVTEKVIGFGASVRGSNWQAVWVRARVKWDDKGLREYAESHPELLIFRQQGRPKVRFLKVRQQAEDHSEEEDH